MPACRFGLTRRDGFRVGQQRCLKDFTFAISEPFDLNLNPNLMADTANFFLSRRKRRFQ
jgi:hypothetical protein